MKSKNIAAYTGLLILGLLLGYLFFGTGSGTDTESQSATVSIAEAHNHEDDEIVYTCSMHPQVRENEPGYCPICGMELIPADDLSSADGSLSDDAIRFSPAALALAEIETTPVRMGSPVSVIRLPGKVDVSQHLVSNVTAHFPGRVRDLYVDYIGDYVRKGQKLASLYSPELITAQRELLETARFKEQNPRLYEAARRKLLLWEFPEETINQIERSGDVMEQLDFFSPVSGYVSEISISREDHVMEGSMMYRIADLSSVWVEFDAYESSANRLEVGDEITFTASAVPGQTFTGRVSFVDPFLNNDSRTLGVRVTADNPKNRLKPGMYTEGLIQAGTSDREKMLVPASAILWTGTRSIVFADVSFGDTPAFEAREVTLGHRAGSDFVVESGLTPGERVVTHGTFKVDAAAQLSNKLSMMNREAGGRVSTGAHDHGSMNMEGTSDVLPDNYQSQNSIEEIPATGSSLEEMIPAYLRLGDALSSDNFQLAKQLVQNFTQENVSDIEELRAVFKNISETIISRVEEEGYRGTLYKQYCPMYGGGSSWISDSEAIENPFYGSMMHNCGETVETL